MNKRENWIDWSKTLLIFLMVLGHNDLPDWGRLWIYGFHMPAFFIISGYLYKERDWMKTLRGFVVPVFVFSLIRFLFYVLNQYRLGTMDWDCSLWGRCLLPFLKTNVENEVTLFSGVWFIVCLFICRLLCGDLWKVSSSRVLYAMGVCCFAFMCLEPLLPISANVKDFFLYRTIACLPFFVMGIFWKREKMIGLKFKPLLLLGLFMLYVILSQYQGYVEFYSGFYGVHYAVMAFVALIASYCLFCIACKLRASDVVTVLSMGTILILGVHKILINIMELVCKVGANGWWIASVVFSVCVMVICYGLIKLALRYCPLLLGK